MTLIKQSARTLRRPCSKCGAADLYWAREDETGKYVMVEKNALTAAAAKFEAVPESSRHDCTGKGKDQEQDVPDAEDVQPAPEPAPEVKAPASSSSEAAALQALRALIGTPVVDRDEIMVIARSVIDGMVFPTRTVLVKDDVKREVEGDTHRQLADVTTAILSGEHVMMVGPAGTGKSTIAEQAAEALGLRSFSISLSPQTPASAIVGYMQAQGEYVRTLFREAYENGGVFHFDEVDNAHPSVLAVVNAALANGHMAFPDGMVKRHADFRAVASANTYGRGATRQYVGRQAIDGATLDRFTVLTIEIDEALETALSHATGANTTTVDKVLKFVRKLRKNAEANGLNVILSPRAAVGMCRLIHAGMDWDAAVDARVRRGLDDATWSKLSR